MNFFRPGTTGFLHLVRPQSQTLGTEMQLLVEFSNRFFALPAGDIPTVRESRGKGCGARLSQLQHTTPKVFQPTSS